MCLMSSPSQESQSCRLFLLSFLISPPVLSPVALSVLVRSLLMVSSPELSFFSSRKFFLIFRQEMFFLARLLLHRMEMIDGGIYSMLPYDTGICRYAFM